MGLRGFVALFRYAPSSGAPTPPLSKNFSSSARLTDFIEILIVTAPQISWASLEREIYTFQAFLPISGVGRTALTILWSITGLDAIHIYMYSRGPLKLSVAPSVKTDNLRDLALYT